MPLLGLRPADPDKDLRRRSTADALNLFRTKSKPASATISAEDMAGERDTEAAELGDQGPATAVARPSTPPSRNPPINTSLNGSLAPPSPPVQEETASHRRFSMLRFRHASDPQLSSNARGRPASPAPPLPSLPPAPQIITTTPTFERSEIHARPAMPKKKLKISGLRPSMEGPSREPSRRGAAEKRQNSEPSRFQFNSFRSNRSTPPLQAEHGPGIPPPDAPRALLPSSTSTTLLSPPSQDSTRQQRLQRRNSIQGGQATPAQTGTSRSSRFRFGRQVKKPTSLFPLPDRTTNSGDGGGSIKGTARTSLNSPIAPFTSQRPQSMYSPPLSGTRRSHFGATDGNWSTASLDQAGSSAAANDDSQKDRLTSSVTFAAPESSLPRNSSNESTRSSDSSPIRRSSSQTGVRPRSSTVASVSGRSGRSDEVPPTPPLIGSGRNSTSTAGRSSFSNLFGLGQRFRQNSDSQLQRHGSSAQLQTVNSRCSSKPSSLSISREPPALPEREAGETAGKYLSRLEDQIPRNMIASLLSKSGDAFFLAVLRSHMRTFAFFGEPVDMALRKLLMDVTLPKETQQIDRVVQGFAHRYHECNPGIFITDEQAYFIAFSLIILHTDVFNKNNKYKMQKMDYVKNASVDGISEEVLACFYDNISYTPFIHVDDDSGRSSIKGRGNRHQLSKEIKDPVEQSKKASKEPLDPYNLILDSRLDSLRPQIREDMNLEDPYSYLGTADFLDIKALQRTFFRYGVLQIVSARSRPDAFTSPATIHNPAGAQAGVVDVKVTKIGILWRKSARKRAGRSPWNECGVILTGTQLYFFRNVTWIKNLMHQYEVHRRHRPDDGPVVFKPPLQEFKPDVFLPIEDSVALVDSNYRRHKHAFSFIRHGGLEETLLAESDHEMNDWLARLNYASAFVTAGVTIRGLVGNDQDRITAEANLKAGQIDRGMAQQIIFARRDMMQRRITEAEEKIGAAIKRLDAQLRSARHLQVLAPIHPKSRESVVHAAGRMAAKLKWARLEMWRIKCHRDILALDLEADRKSSFDVQSRAQQITAAAMGSSFLSPPPQAAGKASNSSAADSNLSTTTSSRPGSRSSGDANEGLASGDGFKTPPEEPYLPNPVTSDEPWDPFTSGSLAPARRDSTSSLPNALKLNFDSAQQGPASGSKDVLPPAQPTPSALASQASSSPKLSDAASSKYSTSGRELKASEPSKQLVTPETDKRPKTAGEASPIVGGLYGSPEPRRKVRHSLQRTMRESREITDPGGGMASVGAGGGGGGGGSTLGSSPDSVVTSTLSGGSSTPHHHHHRSRRRRESGSNQVSEEAESAVKEEENEILSRSNGSFTLHGKKASVITFGPEWQKMPAGERLRQRKSSTLSQTAPLKFLQTAEGSGSGGGGGGDTIPMTEAAPGTTTTADDAAISMTSLSTTTARSIPAVALAADRLASLKTGEGGVESSAASSASVSELHDTDVATTTDSQDPREPDVLGDAAGAVADTAQHGRKGRPDKMKNDGKGKDKAASERRWSSRSQSRSRRRPDTHDEDPAEGRSGSAAEPIPA